MEQSDEALVQACRAGSQAAWELLVERYQRLVFSIARHTGLDQEQSADVFQRVFTTLVERVDRIEQPASIRSWLITTTRHEAWRLSRQERARRHGAEQEGPLEISQADEAQMPDILIMRLEEQHMVYSAVQALNERCRGLLIMLFYQAEPPPYADIAAALQMSEGSIGPTRARCLKKLRQLLEDGGI
ncbi:hypothetical protein SE17_05370 [Kouleothrix aurantiaca]|uniref:RNA polymerase sigma-70 region 2 domain-containing protein n=1 Tax=Kouleothrix aurantiaca TaxID=186479 RepID=A0A0P9DKX4_9CHLR|nr:hypothetical protein SE17_05370 [Kouleothrix aurantiaca]